MSTTSTGTPPAPTPAPAAPNLCHGLQIEYKAFARPFTESKEVGTLYLLASCSYVTSGFTIFFEEDSGNFKLMEQPPTGVFMNLVTYYAASWPTSGIPGQREMPKHVTITDAYGDHKVHVKEWE
ncbi:MAG: hypothetical protein WAK33_12730 [Silvibacterium sp.]